MSTEYVFSALLIRSAELNTFHTLFFSIFIYRVQKERELFHVLLVVFFFWMKHGVVSCG